MNPLCRTTEPSFSRIARMASAGCVLTVRPARDPHGPAADDGRGQERHGVGQIGLDDPVPRGDRAGGDPPAVGLRCRRRRRPRRAASPPSSPRAAPTAPTRRCARWSVRRRTPLRTAAGRRRTATSADASISTVPPATVPAAAHRERQAVAVDVHAEAAQRVEQRRDRAGPGLLVAVEHDGLGASAATGGTNRSTVPARPQSTRASGGRGDAAADASARCRRRRRSTPSVRKRADHQVGVAAAQRAADRSTCLARWPAPRAPARDWSATSSPAPSPWRAQGVGRRCLPVCVTASILPCRAFLPPWDICVGDSR